MSDKIACEICGKEVHVIQKHLAEDHAGTSVADYQSKFPSAPLLSPAAIALVAKKKAEKEAAERPAVEETVMAMAGSAAAAVVEPVAAPANVATLIPKGAIVKKPLHEVFELGTVKEAMSAKGDPIPISVLGRHDQQELVPEVSSEYVYNPDELKDVILAVELNMPLYIWGHKGSGKSELGEQTCARTNRPLMRVQHSANTEESHITGQWTVKGGNTHFELGPLSLAMIHGWTYLADEYDFAQPSVLAVYQPVLEGKALIIKEAPAESRVIKPHRDFRFIATGNTNGSGDETGLYQGTLIQNSANYDRFGMVIHKKYMEKEAEAKILMGKAKLSKKDADRMVEFATLVRQSYDGAKMSDTISPRTLINASKIGVLRGSFRHGLEKSFIGKLSKVDREVAGGLAQRIFGAT